MKHRQFILGVGAQKAGTSWLFDQISKSPNYKSGLTKEYHIFDALHLRKGKFFKNSILENERLAIKRSAPKNDPDIMRGSFLHDPENYFSYFDSLLTPGSCSADITPTYSGLPREVYAEIREGILKKGIKIKVVFLMREPISRLISSTKMHFRLQEEGFDRNAFIDKMHRLRVNGMDDIRSQYAECCTNLENVFSKSELFFGFYETMFEPNQITRLANFLELDPEIFDQTQRINVSDADFLLKENEWQELRNHYDDRYQFVKTHFSSTNWAQGIDKIWENSSRQLIMSAN